MTEASLFAPPVTVAWADHASPPRGGLHVWRIALDAPDHADPRVLSAAETARADRLADPARRRRFIAMRIAARHILARYVEAEPHAIEFGAGHRGKPHVTRPPTRWTFNLTDSGTLALLALDDRGPVGVDLEGLRAVARWDRIARRTFGEPAHRALAAAPPDARDELFLAHWTAHEARQKATGEGLHGARADAAHWQVLHFRPGPGWIAALAFAAGVEPRVSWLDYRRVPPAAP